MNNEWKMFMSESGICSLENRQLEERSFYRMKVYLRNYYKDQYTEPKKDDRETQHKSFLYQLSVNLKGKDIDRRGKHNIEERHNIEFYITRKKFQLTWDQVLGLVISAVDITGNDIIKTLNEQLAMHETWI